MANRRDTTARTALIAAIVFCTAMTALAFVGLVAEVRSPGASALPLASTPIGGVPRSTSPPVAYYSGLPQNPPGVPGSSVDPADSVAVADAGVTTAAGAISPTLLGRTGSRTSVGSTSGRTRPGTTDTTVPPAADTTSTSAATTSTTRSMRHPSTTTATSPTTTSHTTATSPTTNSHTTTTHTTTTVRDRTSSTTEQPESSQRRDNVTTTLRDTRRTTSGSAGRDEGSKERVDTRRGDERPEREVIQPRLRDDHHSGGD